MSWLVASAEKSDVAALRVEVPTLWHSVRRFNAPVQLAVAAAHEVATHAVAPAEAALISLAPCRPGSAELTSWVQAIEAGNGVKMNPTHTLHAVDNLALSVLSLRLQNHAWGMSLAGAAGMAWVALELVGERLVHEREAIVVAGDQDAASAAGVALVFSREPAPYGPRNAAARLVAIARRRAASQPKPTPHAATGLRTMLASLAQQPPGRWTYLVPDGDGDGIDDIAITWELA